MTGDESTALPKKAAPLAPSLGGEFTTQSPEETFEIGRRIGEQLIQAAVLLLSGELGAGKTVFTKGVAKGLGIDPSEIASPSFTLVNLHEGRLRLYHVDLYRLDAGASFELGIDEMLEEANAVTVIEWAERLSYRPESAIEVLIETVSETDRTIRVSQLR